MGFVASLFHFVTKFGGLGLFVLGVLDSSFLVAPWGNDLLVIVLTAHHRNAAAMLYYAAMSTAGSVLGCLLLDLTIRPLGEKGLERHLSKRQLERIKAKSGKSTGKALALASLAPPPFPFTAFVIGASALQYSRRRMMAIIAATRAIRFVAVGFLGLEFGASILRWGKNPVVQGLSIGIIVVSIVASVASVYGWIRRSKSK